MLFDMRPAIHIQGTVIVQAQEVDLGPPAQAVSDVKRRNMATAHAGLAVGADMYFIEMPHAGVAEIHGVVRSN